MILSNFQKLAYMVCLVLCATICGCKKSDTAPTDKKPQSIPVVITSLSVNDGPYNTAVEITGTGFDAIAANDEVFFNSKAATISSATATKLTAIVPLGAGTGKVSVSVKNGSPVLGPVFTYELTAFVSTLAGQPASGSANGKGAAASFYAPTHIALDDAGNLYVTDMQNRQVRKIDPDGNVTTFVGKLRAGTEDGTGAGASFYLPWGITRDALGNFYVSDIGNYNIRKITPSGTVTTLTPGIAAPYADFLMMPEGIAADATGNMYVVDYSTNLARKISVNGKTNVILAGNRLSGSQDGTGASASFNRPCGIAFSPNGLLYIADSYNNTIRQMNVVGTVLTWVGTGKAGSADGSSSTATFNHPADVAFDKARNMYIVDQGNNLIRKMTYDGVVSTLAGSGAPGSADGPAKQASFNNPTGIAVDAAGNLYIADQGNNMIRKITMQ
ncbi:IPT/TIG domain-containing protein [Mucilaginibacter ginsenosidivorans]|uniref:IPT/TIG domain-containing protein n=1 Tax=Mucilaginibacter ginsenosidivorans TaxID=398053 RepID=A0A5B8V2A4_9SPHI|nr:IPT/TIG domain-containing protein [Mucilaginibacter ginsenosidivorans]QEC64811.1 hypothetical protein FRZ54_20320 [Mucilaginibacter ginsenosidivorans]